MNRPGHEHCEAVVLSRETQLADAKALLAKRAKVRVTCHDAVLKYRDQAKMLRGKLEVARISEMNAHDALACLQSDYDALRARVTALEKDYQTKLATIMDAERAEQSRLINERDAAHSKVAALEAELDKLREGLRQEHTAFNKLNNSLSEIMDDRDSLRLTLDARTADLRAVAESLRPALKRHPHPCDCVGCQALSRAGVVKVMEGK